MTHTTTYEMTEDEFIDSIADGDYIFVIDAQGNLKSVLMPETVSLEPIPDEVQQVMGIFDLSHVANQTIH